MVDAAHKSDPRGIALDAGLPLAGLAEALHAALEEPSAGSIHALRTIAAKYEARLRLCGRRALRDDLRALRRACATVRDLDACPPHALVAEELHARRAEAAATLAGELRAMDRDALCAALSFVPGADLARALERLRAWQRKFLEQGRAAWRHEDAGALHALRRRARRIRHAREWLGLDAAAFARAHSALGRWHDFHVSGAPDKALLDESVRAAKAAWRDAVRRVLEEGGAP
jgi:hypothetical protein